MKVTEGPADDWLPVKLAIVPTPVPNEHLAGYVRRLCRANGLGHVQHLHRLLGTVNFDPGSAQRTWSRFVAMTGLATDALKAMRHPPHAWQRPQPIVIEGSRFTSDYLVGQALRFCPACFEEDALIRNRWFLHHVAACDRHGFALVDACECGHPLKTRFVGLDLECPQCGRPGVDQRRTPASAESMEMVLALFHPDRGAVLAHAFLELDGVAKVAVVERLGRLVALTADDEAIRRTNVFFAKKAELVPAGRNLDASVPLVHFAVHILSDWPTRYHELLDRLIDRAPYQPALPPILRRMSTEAGFLAARTLHDREGRPVEFLDVERETFLFNRLGIRKHQSDARPSSKFGSIGGGAASASLQPDRYMSAKTAAEALGATAAGSLVAWIDAGLVAIHDADGEGHLVVASTVVAAIELFDRLAPSIPIRERLDLVSFVKRDYRRAALIADIASGHVGAAIERRDLGLLENLAIDARDVAHRHACCRLTLLAASDEWRETARLRPLLDAAWDNDEPMSVRELKRHERRGMIVGRPGAFGWDYRIRDIIALMNQSGRERLIDIDLLRGNGPLAWRTATLRTPPHPPVVNYSLCR